MLDVAERSGEPYWKPTLNPCCRPSQMYLSNAWSGWMDKAFDQALTHSEVDTIRSPGAEWSCLGLQKFRHKRSAMYTYWSEQPVKRHGDVSVKMTFYGRPCWSSHHWGGELPLARLGILKVTNIAHSGGSYFIIG